MSNKFTEDALIEQPAIALLGKLGWQTVNCFDETFDGDTTNQQRTRELLLSAFGRRGGCHRMRERMRGWKRICLTCGGAWSVNQSMENYQ